MLRRFAAAASIAVLSVTWVAEAEEVRVFILAGQSNMAGHGLAAELPNDLASQPDVLYDHFNSTSRTGGDYAGTTSTDWEPLAPKGTGAWYGPEVTFGARIKALLGGERAAIVKLASSGTSVTEHWARGAPADLQHPVKSQLYHALLGALDSATYGAETHNELLFPAERTRLDAALARLGSAGHSHRLGCLVWVQGESESGTDAAFGYQPALTGFISDVRADLGEPDLPVVLGRIAAQTGASRGGPYPDDNLAAVRAAQEAVADADPRVDWVDMDDLPGLGDHLHFDGEGHRMLGERLADSCAALLDEPPASNATSSSTVTSSSTGGAAQDGRAPAGCSAAGPGQRSAAEVLALALGALVVRRRRGARFS